MVKKGITVLGCMAFLLNGNCLAEAQEDKTEDAASKETVTKQIETVKKDKAAENKTVQTLEVSAKARHFNYGETESTSSEDGWLRGYHISYKSQNTKSKNYWEISYENTYGYTGYHGWTLAGNELKSDTKDKIIEVEAIYGVPIAKNQYIYTGYGYHRWGRYIWSSSPLMEQYSWQYIPLGYRNEFKINKKWSGAFDFALRFMTYGDMHILGGVVTLGNRTGVKVKVPFNYKMDEKWSLVIMPWYQYTDIGRSDLCPFYYRRVKYGVYEPASKNNQYGVNLGVAYTF